MLTNRGFGPVNKISREIGFYCGMIHILQESFAADVGEDVTE
jgi:hypothetical protein